MHIITDGVFETQIIDFGKKIFWWDLCSIQKKNPKHHFFTVLKDRYLCQLEWMNHQDNQEKISGIQEDIILRNLKDPWVCLLLKTSDYSGVMVLGGAHRLLFKRPISSLTHPTIERDECLEFLKPFFSDIEVKTYQEGFDESGFGPIPAQQTNYLSYYGFKRDQMFKIPSQFLVFFAVLAFVFLRFQNQTISNLQDELAMNKTEIDFLKQNNHTIPILDVLSKMELIHYFKVKIDGFLYENNVLTFNFRGPKNFETYLFPVLKVLFKEHQIKLDKKSFIIKL
jgi:hypothetical protein